MLRFKLRIILWKYYRVIPVVNSVMGNIVSDYSTYYNNITNKRKYYACMWNPNTLKYNLDLRSVSTIFIKSYQSHTPKRILDGQTYVLCIDVRRGFIPYDIHLSVYGIQLFTWTYNVHLYQIWWTVANSSSFRMMVHRSDFDKSISYIKTLLLC